MLPYLIAYKLHDKPPQNYDNILNIIRTFPNTELSESAYAITTDLIVADIFEKFVDLIDDDDQLVIIHLSDLWGGQVEDKTHFWLEHHLKTSLGGETSLSIEL